MASYAIAFNYFTGFDIGKCFEAYCPCFGVDYSGGNWREAEQKYIGDFPKRHQNRLGYEVVIELHENSSTFEFDKARQLFTYKLYREYETVSHLKAIEDALKNQEALLNITYRSPNAPNHSVTVFYSENSLLKRDTNESGIERINSLAAVDPKYPNSDLADALLLTKK